MTSTYDHRIIQGGRVRPLPEGSSRDQLQGDDGFYEKVPSPTSASRCRRPRGRPRPPRRPPPPRRRPSPPLRPTSSCCRPFRPPRRSSRRTARTATSRPAWDPLGAEPEGDPAPRPRAARPDARDHAPHPGQDPAHPRGLGRRWPTRCRTCATPTAARSPTRSSTSPRTASGPGCARRSSPARFRTPADHGRAEDAAQAAHRGGRLRALHAQGLPGPEAVLDRGPRHDGADARRAHPARRGGRWRGRS